MIVDKIDFSNLFSKIESFLIISFGENIYNKIKRPLIKNFNQLTNANLSIYQANMKALEFREQNYSDLTVYSHLELKARKSGEQRVKTKIKINKLINKIYPTAKLYLQRSENWTTDDIVYSIGEMIDRLIIEEIKKTDYLTRIQNADILERRNLKKKIQLSRKWSREVEYFLKLKLKEINKKGYYECLKETRTYNLKRDKQQVVILDRVNFSSLYSKITKLFFENFPVKKLMKIKIKLQKEIKILARANFRCYQANMKIIELRKNREKDPKGYSGLDLLVRVVGEQRVQAKSKINAFIHELYYHKQNKLIHMKNWASNDIVYSVGDMIDRLTIEFIKMSNYKIQLKNAKSDADIHKFKAKISLTQEWTKRLEEYLQWKLKEINEKSFYDYVEETRTYNVSKIKKDFVKKL